MNIPAELLAIKNRIAAEYFSVLAQGENILGGVLPFPFMTGVGVEFTAEPDGSLSANLRVVIYLSQAVPLLPTEIELDLDLAGSVSASVQFRVTGPFRPTSFRVHKRPAPSGYSIGPRRFDDVSGTLGAVVSFDAHPDDWFILTCNHVVAFNRQDFSNASDEERSVLQPAGGDDPAGIPNNAIGFLENQPPVCLLRKVPASNLGDFALVKIANHSSVRLDPVPDLPRLASRKPLSFEDYLRDFPDRRLCKAGRETEVRHGIVHTPSGDFALTYGEPDGTDLNSLRCAFRDQFFVTPVQNGQPFADDGDSGSLAMTEDGHAVGLVFAKNDTNDAVVCPLDRLFALLGLSFVTHP